MREIAAFALVIACVFLFVKGKAAQTKYIEKPVYVEKPVEKEVPRIVYVEKPVIKEVPTIVEKEVIRTVEVPKSWRNRSS